MSNTLSRRTLVTGLSVVATVPTLAVASAKAVTPIGKLWGEAEVLRGQLSAHRAEIEKAAIDGVPGWMRLGTEANRIAEARYGKLIEILNAPARNLDDLKIIGQVSMDTDILNGARSWAAERFASAALALAA